MKQIPLPIGVATRRTFDSFLPGANEAAVSHLRALGARGAGGVAAAGGAGGDLAGTWAPVYLWGASGSGKTHLLQALVNHADQQGLRSGWFSDRDAAPWYFDEAWALVVIDACDGLDADQQHAAFALFVEAATRSVPVAAAGRVPPVDLPLREDLRTRLAWGHVFAIQPLAETEVRAALRREADGRGLFLSDDVMDYLLTRFERDLKHLMAQLDRLDTFSMATQRAITVPMLKRMLAEESTP